MLVTFISYELPRVNKSNSKMQEIAPYNIAVTGTQKRLHVHLLNIAASFKLHTVSFHFTAMFNTQTTCIVRLY